MPARLSGRAGVPLSCPIRKLRMNVISTAALALAMSTDAFAAAVGKGAALQKPQWSEALRTGAIFGTIETITPLIGWALGQAAAPFVERWDHWIAFVLLFMLGAHMIFKSFADDEVAEVQPRTHTFWALAATGLATSIDAMAVGASLAFVDANILVTAAAIGIATFSMVTIGVMVGRSLGDIAGKRAELVGGLVLIVIGSLILYEHLGIR